MQLKITWTIFIGVSYNRPIPQGTCPISHNIRHWNSNVRISVPMLCIVGYERGAFSDLWDWSIDSLYLSWSKLILFDDIFQRQYPREVIYPSADERVISTDGTSDKALVRYPCCTRVPAEDMGTGQNNGVVVELQAYRTLELAKDSVHGDLEREGLNV